MGTDGPWLALERELDNLAPDGIANEPQRVVSEQDLPRSSRLLEPCRNVDRVARDERVALARDNRTGVEADPRVEVELVHDVPQLDRGPRGAERVVLRRHRNPEHGHHRIPDELLDGAAMPLENDPCGVVVAVHQRTKGFRIGPVADRRRPREVAEEHGHDLPDLPCRGCAERSTAGGAEPELVGALAPALTADRHGASLRRPWNAFTESERDSTTVESRRASPDGIPEWRKPTTPSPTAIACVSSSDAEGWESSGGRATSASGARLRSRCC